MTTPTAHQAIALAQASLENSELLLTPQTGTPLAAIMSVPGTFNWSFDHISTMPEDEQLDALSQMVADETVSDLVPLVDNHHGQIVRDIAAAVTAHISYAKNTVLPLVLEFQNKVQEAIEAPNSFVNQFNVMIRDLPEFMLDDGFRSEVERAAGGSALEPEKQVRIPAEGPEFVTKYLKTGSGGSDKAISAWAAALGDKCLMDMWDFFYGNGSGSIGSRLTNREDGVDYALFAFLTARRLYDDVPDGVVMTLTEFRRYISQYRDCAANSLRNVYGREDSLEKTGIVVSSYNQFNREVRVNGKTYRDYIKQGGKNEVIFGSMYAGATTQTIGDLLGKTDEYYQNYARQEAMVAATRRLQSTAVFKGALKGVFLSLLADPTSDEMEALNVHGLSTAVIGTRVHEQIEALSNDELKDVNSACLKVMCRTRFSYTDAEKFLTSMNEAQQANPALDAREAAHIAMIELVTDYVCAQIVTTRIR